MSYTVFIDGAEGTTGLKIRERFSERQDVTLLKLEEHERKDVNARKKMLNEADYVFLCLPDVASKEAVSLVENPDVKIIDASTAHRTQNGWDYGLPELSQVHFDNISKSKRVAVPGCYASGFLTIAYPLIMNKIMGEDYPVTCYGLSGYSGGGKSIIAQYESENKEKSLFSPRIYALSQEHKHLPEMQKISGLSHPPVFNPVIDDYFAGMLVSVPLHSRLLTKNQSAQEVHAMFTEHYKGQKMVRVMPFMGETVLENGFLPANSLENKDYLEIFVCGHENQVLVTSRLDNLGKGASGAAVQNMNIMMGLDLSTGLMID